MASHSSATKEDTSKGNTSKKDKSNLLIDIELDDDDAQSKAAPQQASAGQQARAMAFNQGLTMEEAFIKFPVPKAQSTENPFVKYAGQQENHGNKPTSARHVNAPSRLAGLVQGGSSERQYIDTYRSTKTKTIQRGTQANSADMARRLETHQDAVGRLLQSQSHVREKLTMAFKELEVATNQMVAIIRRIELQGHLTQLDHREKKSAIDRLNVATQNVTLAFKRVCASTPTM